MLHQTESGGQVAGYIQRNLLERTLGALRWSPVVTVHGPRQVGKTVFVRDMVAQSRHAHYLTFDDALVRSSAAVDPQGFVLGLDLPATIDEVQRVSEVMLPIKLLVDRDGTAGQFLLTGSTDVRLMKTAADSLAGRMVTSVLWPLSQGEIEGRVEQFVPRAFAEEHLPNVRSTDSPERTVARVLRGGYPMALELSDADRGEWARALLGAIVERDVLDVARVADSAAMSRLLVALAGGTAQLLNLSRLTRDLSMTRTTAERYLATLERVYVVRQVAPWLGSVTRRLTKSPKALFVDTGLAAGLLRYDAQRLLQDRELLGRLIESFVGMELTKQIGFAGGGYQLLHYRDHAGPEVDWVLEAADGSVVGIEVKATEAPGADDFAGLRSLQSAAGDRFKRGIVLHLGRDSAPFGDRMVALPIEAIWRI